MVKQVNAALRLPMWSSFGKDAISAMKMPTPAMLEAGHQAASGHMIGGEALGTVAIAVWQAMIEEALK